MGNTRMRLKSLVTQQEETSVVKEGGILHGNSSFVISASPLGQPWLGTAGRGMTIWHHLNT